LGEVGGAGDEAAEPHDPADAVEVAVAGGLEVDEDVDEAEARGFASLFGRDAPAQLAGDGDAPVDRGDLAGDDHQAAADGIGDIVGDRRHRAWQGDTEFRELRLDLTGHPMRSMSFTDRTAGAAGTRARSLCLIA